MRSEKQVYDTILSLAKTDERIRMVTLEGSRTNINIPPDDFQDFDITFFVTDMQSFTNAIDCLLTAVMFCFVGFFNGCGKTLFVMLQGVIGAFCVRIPVVFLMSQISGATLFHIGLGTPASSAVQILLCLIAYKIYTKQFSDLQRIPSTK